MPVKKYRKTDVVVEAVRWTGENRSEIDAFMDIRAKSGTFNTSSGKTIITTETYTMVVNPDDRCELEIHTSRGLVTVAKGDYILKDTLGFFYPCASEVFNSDYVPIDAASDGVPVARNNYQYVLLASLPSWQQLLTASVLTGFGFALGAGCAFEFLGMTRALFRWLV